MNSEQVFFSKLLECECNLSHHLEFVACRHGIPEASLQTRLGKCMKMPRKETKGDFTHAAEYIKLEFSP